MRNMPVVAHQKMIQELGVEVIAVPNDTFTTAIAGDFINMANADRVLFIIAEGLWTNTVDAADVTLAQATNAAGSDAKPLAFSEKWAKVAFTGGKWVRADVTSNTYKLSLTDNTVSAIEVHAEMLDRDNGFNFVTVNVADPGGNNAALSCIIAIIGGVRYQGDPAVILPDFKV